MGNVIDMAISGTHIIPEPATEFFLYALLMILTMGIFIILGKLTAKVVRILMSEA